MAATPAVARRRSGAKIQMPNGSAITNPIAEGVRNSVMAADVLMGNDQDATRWIRRFRVEPPEGEAGGRRVNRRRAALVG